MGFANLGFLFLVLLFQLHLLSTHQIISQENPLVAEFDKQQKIHPPVQEKSVVSRRGGGGGGHGGGHGGFGGHMGSEGSHGNGDQSSHTHGGGSVIPLYAAGAAGGAATHHRNDDNRHHHGSNDASRRHGVINYLLCFILMTSLVFVYFV